MKRGFRDAQTRRSVGRFFYFDVWSNATATVEDAADRGLHCRSGMRNRSWRSQRQRRLEIAWCVGSRRLILRLICNACGHVLDSEVLETNERGPRLEAPEDDEALQTSSEI